jgi:hypothetical protein
MTHLAHDSDHDSCIKLHINTYVFLNFLSILVESGEEVYLEEEAEFGHEGWLEEGEQ